MRKKQVDVESRILKCMEQSAKEDNIENGEALHFIYILTEDVYNTNSPTHSQLNSVYRAVSNLEKKGLLYSHKKRDVEKGKIGGARYQKEIYATIKDGRIVEKKC